MNSRSVLFSLCAASAIALTGCEWGSSGDNTWNDSYAWANFTGTYRFTKAIVAGEGGEEETTESYTRNGQVNVTAQSSSQIGGVLEKGTGGIVPGSVKITGAFGTATDDGSGNLVLNGNNRGKVSYSGGTWNMSGLDLVVGSQVNVVWQYKTASTTATSSGTAVVLSYLNVVQKGNKLTLSGDSGQVYSGQLSGASMRPDGYVAAQTVYLSFSASSSSGRKITGSLSGVWSGASDKNYGTLSSRQIHGTFSDGTTFVGTAADVTIHVPDTTVSE